MITVVSLARDSTALVPSVLDHAPRRLPIGGRVRAGIKVLTRTAEQYEKARTLYDQGVTEGLPFEDIEAAIRAACPDLKGACLVPKNVPWFTVRPGDFTMPELAAMILAKYGEDRGDGVRRLYRFPVVFPVDRWQEIMPHALRCYGARQLKYWSQYTPDGSARHCMRYEEVRVDASSKRAVRLFGGRKSVPREDNHGVCDPEQCPEYQARECNLTGSFLFFIPGIPTIDVIELPTNSFYSMNAARQKLELVAFMRGGRLSGHLGKGQTFWITKKLHAVAMIDERGTPTRVKQWLIELEANIDVTTLLRGEDAGPDTMSPEVASTILEGGAVCVDDLPGNANGAGGPRSAGFEGTQGQIVASAEEKFSDGDAGEPERTRVKALRADVYQRLLAMNIPADVFDRYARKRFIAEDWGRSSEHLETARAELTLHEKAPEVLRAHIDAQLEIRS